MVRVSECDWRYVLARLDELNKDGGPIWTATAFIRSLIREEQERHPVREAQDAKR